MIKTSKYKKNINVTNKYFEDFRVTKCYINYIVFYNMMNQIYPLQQKRNQYETRSTTTINLKLNKPKAFH